VSTFWNPRIITKFFFNFKERGENEFLGSAASNDPTVPVPDDGQVWGAAGIHDK
jgi:hypothetical protein